MSRLALLDSNLLLLYIVGAHSKGAIAKVKRLRAYVPSDFDLLLTQLKHSNGLILTPNTVTEVSNLLHNGETSAEVQGATRQLTSLLLKFGEKYVSSAEIFDHPDVSRLGVTDCVMLTLARTGAILLTADLALWAAAQKEKLDALNFNHLRRAF